MAHILDCVTRAVERFGEAPAIRCADGEMSFLGLHLRIEQCVHALTERGLSEGDRIATYLPNSPEHIVILLAAIRAKLVVCPLSTRIPPEQLPERVQELSAKLLVSDSSADENSVAPGELFTGDLETKVIAPCLLGSDQLALAVYTSGSSGPPKPALLSYGNLVFNALASNENIDVGPGTAWLLSLPLYHVGGLGIVFRCLLDGGCIAIPEPKESLADAINQYDVTHVSLVATQLYRLLRDETDLSRLKAILLGGSAMPEGLVRKALGLNLPIYTSYGMTEMASQITTTRKGDSSEKLHSSGTPLRAQTLRISAIGEIEVTGDTLFQGYLQEGELLRPLVEEEWFRTGDLGHLDEVGYLHVTGRKDNLFISGGENIQPEEIETALCAVDGIAQAVVVPIEDPEFGQRPQAFVRMEMDAAFDSESLIDKLKGSLPSFKIPVAILPWPDDLPESMKVPRREFLDRARQQR